MECQSHRDADVVGMCINCGRHVCYICRTLVGGKICCPDCVVDQFKLLRPRRTDKPIIGGLLCYITVILSLLIIIPLLHYGPIGLGICAVILALFAMWGAANAVARRRFTFAVIGGVCSILLMFPLGIPSFILIAKSRDEFEPKPHNATAP